MDGKIVERKRHRGERAERGGKRGFRTVPAVHKTRIREKREDEFLRGFGRGGRQTREPREQRINRRPNQKRNQHARNAFFVKSAERIFPHGKQQRARNHHEQRNARAQHRAPNRAPAQEIRIACRFRRTVERVAGVANDDEKHRNPARAVNPHEMAFFAGRNAGCEGLCLCSHRFFFRK